MSNPTHQISEARRYRVFHTPRDRLTGELETTETGRLPFVQVRAASAEHAATLAQATTGCPIVEVQRIDTADTPNTCGVAALAARGLALSGEAA